MADIELLLREASRQQWLDMEWYRNILPHSAISGDEANSQGDTVSDDMEGEMGIPTASTRGFGTMMTDATDWLSESRRKDYVVWKKAVLQKIEQIESR